MRREPRPPMRAGGDAPHDDVHHLVIDGRRWRRTDPRLPENVRRELVSELMAARRDVGSAKRRGDSDHVRAARRRVNDAKVALGERGEPWWEPSSDDGLAARRDATMHALTRARSGTEPDSDELDMLEACWRRV